MSSSSPLKIGEKADILRSDSEFRLKVITLIGWFAAVGIAPFAVYRFLTGDTLVGVLDSLAVITSLLVVIYSRRTGRTEGPGTLLILCGCVVAVLVSYFLGFAGVFWVYVLIVGSFCVVKPVKALVLSILVILILAFAVPGFSDILTRISFAVTALVVLGFVLIYTGLAEKQRRMLDHLAANDHLTGVGNRRTMEKELKVANEAFRRTGVLQAVLMMDLDHFKQVNDNFGHSEGDRVLIEFTRITSAACRTGDRLFRCGGEEFLILLPACSEETLFTVGEKVRSSVANSLSTVSGNVTISVGGSALREGEDWESWIRRADEALYKAKELGRNRVIV